MPLTTEELTSASVAQLQEWRQQCDQTIESRLRGRTHHSDHCSVVSDELFDQIVDQYVLSPSGRQKLIESLGRYNPNDYNCPGCAERIRVTWRRIFVLAFSDEWTPRLRQIRDLLEVKPAESTQETVPPTDPPRIIDRLLAPSILDDLCP